MINCRLHDLSALLQLLAEIYREDDFVLYRLIPRSQILETIAHLNALHRQSRPLNEKAVRAFERREATVKTLLSNIPRTKDHPTLKTLREIADIFSLTIEGAHRLFGYNLARIRDYDLRLNGGRTHIVESYGFERDLLVDLPLVLAPEATFQSNGMLRDLVLGWQRNIPFRALDEGTWHRHGTYYVHVGTEDSLGSNLPPGAVGLVEPIDKVEEAHPNPRTIYLLQFGNGYRCSRCVVTRAKLHLITSSRSYQGPQSFAYPGSVRVAGRISAFAMSLPSPEFPGLRSLPYRDRGADLILPWEHRTRDSLFATGHRRFERSKEEEQAVRDLLETQLHSKLSMRTERRYRHPSRSQPHVNALISLTVAHMARYTDSLTTSGVRLSDMERFSLQSFADAKHFADISKPPMKATPPTPASVWESRRKEFVEWPPLLSMRFPQLRLWEDQVVRLAEATPIMGLEPTIGRGSWLLLENLTAAPDPGIDRSKSGWSRPIYVLRRGIEIICGYLDKDENDYALLSGQQDRTLRATFGRDELPSLSRVAGVAVPILST